MVQFEKTQVFKKARHFISKLRFSGGSAVKNLPANGFDPWVKKIPWRRKWQPTAVFLLGISHAQRSLASYSPLGLKRIEHDLVTKQQQKSQWLHSI